MLSRLIGAVAATLLIGAVPFASSEAELAVNASRWDGLYQGSGGEVLRVDARDSVITIDIFAGRNGAWKLTTSWATVMDKPDYAEFRQRAEPDGLWLSISFEDSGARLVSHDPQAAKPAEVFYRRLSAGESSQIWGLPE